MKKPAGLRKKEPNQPDLFEATDKMCGHTFITCTNFINFAGNMSPKLPCPICQPDYNYLQHAVYRIERIPEDDPTNGEIMLLCGQCHDYFCAHPVCGHQMSETVN